MTRGEMAKAGEAMILVQVESLVLVEVLKYIRGLTAPTCLPVILAGMLCLHSVQERSDFGGKMSHYSFYDLLHNTAC